jgi:hypothetical protein
MEGLACGKEAWDGGVGVECLAISAEKTLAYIYWIGSDCMLDTMRQTKGQKCYVTTCDCFTG